jgi:hypothetical protein
MFGLNQTEQTNYSHRDPSLGYLLIIYKSAILKALPDYNRTLLNLSKRH